MLYQNTSLILPACYTRVSYNLVKGNTGKFKAIQYQYIIVFCVGGSKVECSITTIIYYCLKLVIIILKIFNDSY